MIQYSTRHSLIIIYSISHTMSPTTEYTCICHTKLALEPNIHIRSECKSSYSLMFIRVYKPDIYIFNHDKKGQYRMIGSVYNGSGYLMASLINVIVTNPP